MVFLSGCIQCLDFSKGIFFDVIKCAILMRVVHNVLNITLLLLIRLILIVKKILQNIIIFDSERLIQMLHNSKSIETIQGKPNVHGSKTILWSIV